VKIWQTYLVLWHKKFVIHNIALLSKNPHRNKIVGVVQHVGIKKAHLSISSL
jgi:hypothetical protein